MNLSDRYNLLQLKHGNAKVFENLFHEHYEPLCRYVIKIIPSAQTAEEIVQDLFYYLWKNRIDLKIRNSIKAYLYKSVFHRALHQLEHQVVKEKFQTFYKTQNLTPETPEEHFLTKEYNQRYQKVIEELPKTCKNIFTLSRVDGLKNKEIAEKLSCSVKTVEYNISKALKCFKKEFDLIIEK